jgi:hypothetical protein
MTVLKQYEPDHRRADLTRQDNIVYWVRELGVGEAELRDAIAAAEGWLLSSSAARLGCMPS